MLEYSISPTHPLRPERLRRTIELLERYGFEAIDPGLGTVEEALRVHSAEYVEAVRMLDPEESVSSVGVEPGRFGLGRGDNPAFPAMYRSSLAYLGGTARAAEAVRDGAKLAYGLAGGLHHALRDKASGFCIFNDPAVACSILLEAFDRVAYVDIDVHHGDGVQWLFYDEPRVLTCSIHEEARTLWPGTGGVDETGIDFTSLNVPLQAKTTGDVWLDAFRRGILPALSRFRPGAIVLQMGTDSHFSDPLAHLNGTCQEWLAAVEEILRLGLPVVALGGGGYRLEAVPRMWAAACLTLAGVPFADELPADLAEAWGTPRYFDAESPGPRGQGMAHAEAVLGWLQTHHHLNIPN